MAPYQTTHSYSCSRKESSIILEYLLKGAGGLQISPPCKTMIENFKINQIKVTFDLFYIGWHTMFLGSSNHTLGFELLNHEVIRQTNCSSTRGRYDS